jgi:hypothetical protein
MKLKTTILLLFLLFTATIAGSLEKFVDFDLINSAGPPRLLDNGILFTLDPDEGRIIFLRTSLDNWEQDYYFRKSLYGILYTFVPYSFSTSKVTYKLNIDGFWETDPNNMSSSVSRHGSTSSVIDVPETVTYHRDYPLIENTDSKVKNVTFFYYNQDATEVNLLTSADNFSPYSHVMKKDRNGYWTITMPFTRGFYRYYFLVDGKKMSDLENEDHIFDPEIGDVSVFSIE